jgi:uncharacterized protein YjbI with pentapeptide repeats
VSDNLPPVDCGDSSTWRHKGEKIDLPRLIELIEENGGPDGLDLHGCQMAVVDFRPAKVLRAYLRRRLPSGVKWHSPWGGISLRGAHLELANLLHTKLQGADLRDARLLRTVLQGADLEGACIDGADLTCASLPDASLRNARLRDAVLAGAELFRADLEEADLSRASLNNASLQQAHLERADLGGASLQGARLVEAKMTGARLSFAGMRGAELAFAHLERLDLVTTDLRGAFWYGAYLEGTRMVRARLGAAIGDQLAAKGGARRPLGEGHFSLAKEAYLALKANFRALGRYDDASWAYIKEQQMEKAMHFPTTVGHRWVRRCMGGAAPPAWWGPANLPRWLRWKLRSGFYHSRLFLGLSPREARKEMARRDANGNEHDEWFSPWRWIRNWAFELLAGYGERVYMPLIWALVVVALFAGIYAGAGNIASGDGGATHNVLTALTHSIAAFATVGFNTLEPVGWGARLLTAIEAMFGIGLFALFVFTLGNRMRRS